MDNSEFNQFIQQLQNTFELIQNSELRQKIYSQFNSVFDYLNSKQWLETNLVERHEYSDQAVFQNVAEGYFRLGFVEKAFFEYSKLIYELWYEKVVNIQLKTNKRIHKGTQLHQLAWIYHEAFSKFDKAWDYYLIAFIEDILDEREAHNSQAYRALVRLGLADKNLLLIAEESKKFKRKTRKDPIYIVNHLKEMFIIPTYQEVESIDHIKLNRAKKLWLQVKQIK